MELTEKKMGEFFPLNNRFIHYCAKHYKYTFHNDDTVNDARYYSVVNVMAYLKKHGNNFKDEPEMVSMVMSCIRYGILSAFSKKDFRKKQIDLRPFADFDATSTFGSNAGDSFNIADYYMPTEEQEDLSYLTLYNELVEHRLSDFQNKVLQECLINGIGVKEFALEHEVSESSVITAKRNIRNKFKKLIKEEDGQVISNQEYVPQVERRVRKNHGHQSELENEKKEYSYLKAMSFLHS